jgi:hypothetical protein
MAKTITTFTASELAKGIKMTVLIKGLAIWKIRLWLSVRLFKLGAWVAGVQLDISVEKEEE